MYLNFDVKRFEKYSFSYGTSQLMIYRSKLTTLFYLFDMKTSL